MSTRAGQQIGDGPFTLPELARLLGGEYRTLQYWVDRGIIHRGSVRAARQRGNVSLYSHRDACIIRGLLRLRIRGLGIQGLRIVANAWYRDLDANCPVCGSALPLDEEMEGGEEA